MKTFLQIAFTFVLVAMLWATWTASMDRGVLQAAEEIWADPWGRATLFDTYFAFLTVWLWIAWREPTGLRRSVWLVLILTLGNFAIAAYFLVALRRIGPGGSWQEIFRKVEAP